MRSGRVRWRRVVAGSLIGVGLLLPAGSTAPAATDPPDPELACPDVAGYGPSASPTAWYSLREGMVFIFGSTARFSSLSNAECSYSVPTDETSPVDWASIEVFWASAVTTEEHRARPCLLTDTERDGVGVVTAGDVAAYATYAVSSEEPVDTAPFVAAARDLLDQVAPLSSSCDGIAPPPATSTELPPFLAGAFAPADTTGPDTSEPDITEPATTEPATTEPATTGPGTAVDVGADDATDGEVDDAAAAPTGAVGDGDDGDGGLLGIVGMVATIVSVVLLGATFLLIRRETKVRPAVDVARALVIGAVAVAGTILLAGTTSPIAVAVALVAGFALGVWQGSHLAVRAVADGWTARRTGWAVVAFAIGLVVTQVAARLDHVAGQGLGLATTFLAAALAAGVIVGRRPRLVDARRAAGIAAIAFFTVISTTNPAHDAADAASTDPERDETLATLVDLVDWSSVELRGGLFATEGKPPVEVAVPATLDAPPDPVTVDLAWAHDDTARTVTYSVTETYTFGLRSDGECCTVEYAGTGTGAEADGTVTTYEAAGRLDDIQSVALEGSRTSALPSELDGLPFGEVQAFLPSGADRTVAVAADPTTCGRPVAEQRNSYVLDETGGAGELTTYRVDGRDLNAPRYLNRVVLTTDCDVPGFTPADALAAAPAPPPPVDDTSREGGCPVRQEVLATLLAANELPGVDTATTANLFLAPNAAACADTIQLGQGGPGGTRHELRYEFARPTDRAFGDDSSLVDEIYWTDLPLGSDIPADLTCGVGDDGQVLEPTDPELGCHQVDRYEIDDVRVFVWTDWQTWDGPNVLVFVTAPWGSYSYRCHHCTPNDPSIGAFIDSVNGLAVDAAEQIAEVAAAATEATTDEPGDGATPEEPGEEPGDGPANEPTDGESIDEPGDEPAGDAAAAPGAAAESSNDDGEPAAVAALLGLGGAAAMLGLTLGELGGWRGSDAAGAGAGDADHPPAGGDALATLNTIQAFDEALVEYERMGYDRTTAAVLAGIQVHGGNVAGESNPFGGIGDPRLEQLSEAFLPQGIRNAIIPTEVVKNNIRTALQAFDALSSSIRTSWERGEWNASGFDRFGEQLDARPGLDPFAGYHQAMGLVFDELYTDGGRSLALDAMNLAAEWYLGDQAGLVQDPSRVTLADVAAALEESAGEFRDDVAAGAHGPVLQGIDAVFEITAELTTDPAHAVGEFVDDLAQIIVHGVGDGYWTDVADHVDATLRNVPVVKTIYAGYQELFSGVVSHAESAEDLTSGAAAAGFAAEMAEGAAALGAELIDVVQGGDHATRAFDYLRSLF